MWTRNYTRIFLLRFFGYFFIFAGILFLVMTVEPVVWEEAKYRYDQLFNIKHTLPKVVTSAGETSDQLTVDSGQPKGFGSVTGSADTIVPVSTDFGIVIEKINANALVIPDVDPASEQSYINALTKGVAHARGTAYPGQAGNTYLFSHSTDAPWNIVRYNAIFYLLGKLDKGDRIIIFYKGRRYDYIVYDKIIASPTDTQYLTNTYDKPVLTLQTCDPPGTLLNRLIVRAKLAGS